MSGGIFYLDEDREADPSPSSSPRPSPRGSPTLSATDTRSPQSTHGLTSLNTSASLPSSLQIPGAGLPNVYSAQSPGIGRKHAAPFAATPSFPSPLAQAITVPIHSDTSSSGSHSGDDDDVAELDEGERTMPVSPTRSGVERTPKMGSDLIPRPKTASPQTSRSGSPASTQKSLSRPPSPKAAQALTPGALLMKSKRSASGSFMAGSLPSSSQYNRETTASRQQGSRVSPTHHPGPRRFSNVTRQDAISSPSFSSHRRESSGSNASLNVPLSIPGTSSPLAFGSPELEPIRSNSPNRSFRTARVSPAREQRDMNTLGLGWGGVGSWDSSTPGSSPVSSKDKGKGKDAISGPPSPRVSQRDRERTVPGLGVAR